MLALAAAGCRGPLSTLDPGGPMAAAIGRLWWVMLAGAVGLLALMVGLFAWVMRRRDDQRAHPEAASGHDPQRELGREREPDDGTAAARRPADPRVVRRWIGLGGLLMPTTVLVALTGYALWIGEGLLPVDRADVLRVAAQGRMWEWRFAYPDHPEWGESRTLHLPAGRDVHVAVTSVDVIHSFWVPRLAGKIDAIPGRTTLLRLRADEPGRYGGVCAEFCGVGHGVMSFEVVAHAPEDYPARMREGPR